MRFVEDARSEGIWYPAENRRKEESSQNWHLYRSARLTLSSAAPEQVTSLGDEWQLNLQECPEIANLKTNQIYTL